MSWVIFIGGCPGGGDCNGNGKLSGVECGTCKPGEKYKNGVNKNSKKSVQGLLH